MIVVPTYNMILCPDAGLYLPLLTGRLFQAFP